MVREETVTADANETFPAIINDASA